MKKILISVAVIVLVTGVTIGTLVLSNGLFSGSNDQKSVFDLSKDYGACTLLETSRIKSSLGEAAAELQSPQNMGIVSDVQNGEGVESLESDSQICVYAFAPGATAENSYNSGNAFIVQKTIYTNPGGSEAEIVQIQEDPTSIKVNSLGDIAFYNASTATEGPGALYGFDLQVYRNNERTLYQIRQPAETATFTAESARTALTALAASTE